MAQPLVDLQNGPLLPVGGARISVVYEGQERACAEDQGATPFRLEQYLRRVDPDRDGDARPVGGDESNCGRNTVIAFGAVEPYLITIDGIEDPLLVTVHALAEDWSRRNLYADILEAAVLEDSEALRPEHEVLTGDVEGRLARFGIPVDPQVLRGAHFGDDIRFVVEDEYEGDFSIIGGDLAVRADVLGLSRDRSHSE